MSAPTEDFLVVMDDKKFNDKTSFFSKDFGSSAAEVLRSKLTRKLGSTAAIPVSQVSVSELKRVLQPSNARVNHIYRVHPLDRSRYILITQFHDTILAEKREELCSLLKGIGCKYMSWRKHPEWNKSFLAPDSSLHRDIAKIEQMEKGNKFFKTSTTWQKAVHDRLRTWCDVLTLEFSYEMSYNVRDALIDSVYDKIGLTNREKDELLKKPGVSIPISRNQSSLDADEVYRLFSAFTDTVEVQFFSKSDYKVVNVRDIQKRWTAVHVQAFLRIIGMEKLSSVFKDKRIDGSMLFKFVTSSAAQSMLGISALDATMLAGHINELGDLDHMDIVNRVESYVDGGEEYEAATDDLVGKLVVNLGGVGTIDKFLSKIKGGNPGTGKGNAGYDEGFDWDAAVEEGEETSCCFKLFACCSAEEDAEDIQFDADPDPDDFEWGDDLDPYSGGSVTSAGARSAFTGASARSGRSVDDRRRRDRDRANDNMSVASSSVSRPGASRRNRDSGGYSGGSGSSQSKPRRGLGQRDTTQGVDSRILGASRDELKVKIVLTGMPGVGKRRLMRRFGQTEFSESRIRELTRSKLPAKELYEDFFVSRCDGGGNSLRQKLKSNRDRILRESGTAQCLFIVFDLTNSSSFSSISTFIHQKVEAAANLPWCSIVLLGNKLDLDKPPNGRAVSKRMAMELCQKFGIEFYVETSAKTAQNVMESLSVMLYHCKNEHKKGFLW